MNKPMRWILVPATLAVVSLTLLAFSGRRRARAARAEKAAQAADVREWENEGGALARAAGPAGKEA